MYSNRDLNQDLEYFFDYAIHTIKSSRTFGLSVIKTIQEIIS